MTRIMKAYGVGFVIVAIASLSYQLGRHDRNVGVQRTLVPSLYAADSNTYIGLEAGTDLPQDRQVVSPTGVVQDREMYYPGTEALDRDEMRVIACGTGMPNARPKQAAACWLVELGNGDKFIFDIGTGFEARNRRLLVELGEGPRRPLQALRLEKRGGGVAPRWLAKCPGCDRYARKLYWRLDSDRLTCWKCADLTHRSAQAHDRRVDLARRDVFGFQIARGRAPRTLRSQLVTADLLLKAISHSTKQSKRGRTWGRGSTTSRDRILAELRQRWVRRWGRRLVQRGVGPGNSL